MSAREDGRIDQRRERTLAKMNFAPRFALYWQRRAVVPSRRDLEICLIDEIIGRGALGIQKHLVPVERRELGCGASTSAASARLRRRHIIELHLNPRNIARHLQVK